MNKTKIEWTDYSWNPVTGCLHNCFYCYARFMYQRWGRSFYPAFHPERLEQPSKVRGNKKIFVCSVADLFGDWVPETWIKKVLDTVAQNPNHIFQFLTKNPKRLLKFKFPENSWIGCTATNQKMADISLEILGKIENRIRFLSCEPLLGPIRINKPIDWLIIGACTGKYASQPKPEWVKNLYSDGRRLGAAIFFKPNLIWRNPPHEFPRLNNSSF